MALQYILAVGIQMVVAKELLTFCLEPHCKCDPVNEYVTCSGLDFVPKMRILCTILSWLIITLAK